MSDHTATIKYADPQDIKENKLIAILSYLLFFLPLIVCPQSRFARFHANQGLLLLLVTVALNILSRIFSIIPVIRWVFALMSAIVSVLVFIFMILGMFCAHKGIMRPLPLIGHITILK